MSKFSKISIIFYIMTAFLPSLSQARNLDLSGYQKPDGAIVVGYIGNMVDPYFATQALLLAKDSGLNMQEQGKAWVKWALKRQHPEGLFNRYQLNEKGGWDILSAADADDAMLALWIELLYRLTPTKAMSSEWQESVKKSLQQLDALYDADSGIYHISKTLPVGLLMDNVEICLAFKNIAKELRRLGQRKKAQIFDKKSQALAENIYRVFHNKDNGSFLISTQLTNGNNFYPDHVGQLYPILKMMDAEEAKKQYARWMQTHGKEWLKQRNQDYAWGILATMALDMSDSYSAACWQNHAEPMRYSKHWNVVEEAALQNVQWQLATKYQNTKIPCVGGHLQ